MTESLLIALREGLEAALVVSIVLAFAVRSGDRSAPRAVWAGTFAALAVSLAAGIVLHVTIDGLEGDARLRTFAVICIAAGALLTWMIFWMRTHGRVLKAHLESQAGEALAAGSTVALAMVAFTAVLREGLETALFLLSATAAADASAVVIGTLVGLAIAVVLGALLYKGSQRIDLRRFFDVTGALIILFAAGLAAKAVFFLQATGDLGTIDSAVYDLTGISWLTVETQVGRFLAGIFGWDPRPSAEQIVAYVGYLVPIAYLYFRRDRRPAASAAPSAVSVASTH